MKKLNRAGAIDPLFIAVIVIVAVVGYFVYTQVAVTDETVQNTAINNETVSLSTPSSSSASETSQLAPGEAIPVNIEEAVLTAKNGYEANGTATRSFTEGVFSHEVIATIQPLAEGKFYEGWLVGDRVISTGKLENEGGNEWSLVFESDEDFSTFDQIVITEETLADGLDDKPETHVLEGSF